MYFVSLMSLPSVYGGAAGYRPRVQSSVELASTLYFIYTISLLKCQPET